MRKWFDKPIMAKQAVLAVNLNKHSWVLTVQHFLSKQDISRGAGQAGNLYFCRTLEGPAYTWHFNFHTFGPSD